MRLFGTRHATLELQDIAQLDDGVLWPTAFALTADTPEVGNRIAQVVKHANRLITLLT